MKWFDALDDEEELLLPGYVVMELIQGCRNKVEQEKVQRELATYGVAWPAPADCDEALSVFTEYHLSHNAGLLDALIGQIAVALRAPLYTFNCIHSTKNIIALFQNCGLSSLTKKSHSVTTWSAAICYQASCLLVKARQ